MCPQAAAPQRCHGVACGVPAELPGASVRQRACPRTCAPQASVQLRETAERRTETEFPPSRWRGLRRPRPTHPRPCRPWRPAGLRTWWTGLRGPAWARRCPPECRSLAGSPSLWKEARGELLGCGHRWGPWSLGRGQRGRLRAEAPLGVASEKEAKHINHMHCWTFHSNSPGARVRVRVCVRAHTFTYCRQYGVIHVLHKNKLPASDAAVTTLPPFSVTSVSHPLCRRTSVGLNPPSILELRLVCIIIIFNRHLRIISH